MKSLCPMALYRNAFLKSRKNKYHFVDLRVWSLPPTKSLQPLKKTLVLKSRVFLSNWTDLYFVPAYCDGVPVVCGEGDGEKGHRDQAEDGGKRQGQRTTETHPSFLLLKLLFKYALFSVHTTYCLKTQAVRTMHQPLFDNIFFCHWWDHIERRLFCGGRGSGAAQNGDFNAGYEVPLWSPHCVRHCCEVPASFLCQVGRGMTCIGKLNFEINPFETYLSI